MAGGECKIVASFVLFIMVVLFYFFAPLGGGGGGGGGGEDAASRRVAARATVGQFSGGGASERTLVRKTYEPSPLEELWRRGVNGWLEMICDKAIEPESFPGLQQTLWALVSQEIEGPPGGPPMPEFLKALADPATQAHLSHMVYHYSDGSATSIALEPLAGILRDPRTACYNGDRFQPPLEAGQHELQERKPWVLLDPALAAVAAVHAPKLHHALREAPYKRALLFDMGGSRWNDAAGSRWLLNKFSGMGIHFEHIYVWEAKYLGPRDYWEGASSDVLSRVHFFNWPVTSKLNDIDNPFTTLLQVATPEDFVVVKLDIDHAPTELPLVFQLMTDAKLAALVDEFTFEHHVNLREMRKWWGDSVGGNLTDSYTIFRTLRERGIHAHSWP